MSKPVPVEFGGQVINIRMDSSRRHRKLWLIVAAIVAMITVVRLTSVYLSALWFGSLGYGSVYWSMLRLKVVVFCVFALATFVILRGAFWLLERTFRSIVLEHRVFVVNDQPVQFAPARVLRIGAWVISALFAVFYGFAMRQDWRIFALYLRQPPTATIDPIFGKPLGFYLFTLPVLDAVTGWMEILLFLILAVAIVYGLLAVTQKLKGETAQSEIRGRGYAAISFALAAYLVMLGFRFYLSRYPYLWADHQTFSGVNYTEANYLLPGLVFVAVGLLVAAAVSLFNAVFARSLRPLGVALAVPILIYVVAAVLVPAYVVSFIVKPNELGRESPYIEQNINATRQAFGIDRIEQRDFAADSSVAGFDFSVNRPTLDNIRLWDWHALLDTLGQTQAIRIYYDFPDVDVDRYRVGGDVRQMMIAAREINVDKLPEQSRNWINEKLIYTHGYGITMNTANGFTPEGLPLFVVSDMPVVSTAPEIQITRPEIYFGQKTDTSIYVRTREQEFNFPQGESNNYTTYQGADGITIGGTLRRLFLAWALDDLSKLPFSDRVTPDSRALIHRNIRDRVSSLAPFLTYDNDPYIVATSEGHLVWIIDAFTESDSYPYSRHYRAGDRSVNYIRNSVKVTVDAYNGSVAFYVFDPQDPLISAYRAVFPTLFRNASEMPADLRAHVRYPETLIKTQGDVFGLYHTQNAKVFFQRDDVWSVASETVASDENKREPRPLEPYFVLMQLPGEDKSSEFVQILPFTPANRNNMIGWMAARCDGDHYGSLLVFNFPKSRLIDGPLQVEARINQNSQISSQITLWNQQGSHVRHGNLLVIPIGRALLYVESIYLQAERSPMPELRMVVVATEDRLAYGANFQEALRNLFGAALAPGANVQKPPMPGTPETRSSPPPAQGGAPALTPEAVRLINQASRDMDDYRRLTAEGKAGEAGQKLESAMRALEELQKQAGQQ